MTIAMLTFESYFHCRWHKQFELDSQLPFLCGDSEKCRTLGHPEAVSLAMANIEANYVMVGVLEMLEETITVMECLMPDIMSGTYNTSIILVLTIFYNLFMS